MFAALLPTIHPKSEGMVKSDVKVVVTTKEVTVADDRSQI